MYEVVKIKANLDSIPTNGIPVQKGADGEDYWLLEFQIQVTYYSAYRTYELFHNDINYGSATAEYV